MKTSELIERASRNVDDASLELNLIIIRRVVGRKELVEAIAKLEAAMADIRKVLAK